LQHFDIRDITQIKESTKENKNDIVVIKEEMSKFKNGYLMDSITQKRDTLDFSEALNKNIKLFESLNDLITDLTETIKHPVDGLIVKLNKTVESSQHTLDIISKIEREHKIKVEMIESDLENLDEITSNILIRITTIESFKVWFIASMTTFVLATIGMLLNMVYQYITK